MHHNIRIISASAGSGKTWRLAQMLEQEIVGGRVRPEAIVATTFTRKAAAELKERVRSRLLSAGRTTEAQRLGAALIGTVNAVCGEIVCEFAFSLGMSPRTRVLDEAASTRMLLESVSEVVTESERARLAALSRRMEQFDWGQSVHEVVMLARANGLPLERLSACAAASRCAVGGLLDPPTDDSCDGTLRAAIEESLLRLEGLDDATVLTRDARIVLERDLGVLRRGGHLAWGEWLKLRHLKTSLTAGVAVSGVHAAAAEVDRHAGLRADLDEAVSLVFDLARRAGEAYDTRKRLAGMIDFVDQEAQVLHLLGTEEVRSELSGRVDLVLVDEFQDTSPLQLAVFLRLADVAGQSVWVGDQKQAIYGFRGTDPALMDAAVRALCDDDARETLRCSYRSRAPLVRLTSDLFAAAFHQRGLAESFVRLEPARGEDELGPPAEVWKLVPASRRRSVTVDGALLAHAVSAMLADPDVLVRDPASGDVRSVEAHDVAILCYRNATCAALAEALERVGIPAVLGRSGLLECPEVRLVEAGLRLWADPRDVLAAAELARLVRYADDPDAFTTAACQAAGRDPFAHVAEVTRVMDERGLRPVAGVLEAVDAVIEAVQARERCLEWGDSRQRQANLDALRGHCVRYEEAQASAREACTVGGLLAFLRELAERGGDAQAVPQARGAVTLTTWHGAKGLEWPIAVLFELDYERAPQILGVHVASAGEAITFEAPLAGRGVRFWPDPFRARQRGSMLHQRVDEHPLAAQERVRHEGESLRLLYVGWTRARDRVVIAGREGMSSRGLMSPLAGLLEEPCDDGVQRVTWAGREVDVRVRVVAQAPPAGASVCVVGPQRAPGRAAEASDPAREESLLRAGVSQQGPEPVRTLASSGPGTGVVARGPRAPLEPGTGVVASGGRPWPAARVQPSSLTAAARVGRPIRIGEHLRLGRAVCMTTVGEVVHGFLAADLRHLSTGERFEIAAGLIHRWQLGTALSPRALLRAGDALCAWVEANWPGAVWRREWPLEQWLEGGQVLRGACDLVLETPDGLVIIDHKSFPGGEIEAAERAESYAGQLSAYARALHRATGRLVLGTWIHLPVAGVVVPVEEAAL